MFVVLSHLWCSLRHGEHHAVIRSRRYSHQYRCTKCGHTGVSLNR